MTESAEIESESPVPEVTDNPEEKQINEETTTVLQPTAETTVETAKPDIADDKSEEQDPFEAALAQANQKQAEKDRSGLIQKLPVFSYANAKEDIADTSKTFDELRNEIPKAYMHGISLLEDFMELIGNENLFTYSTGRDSKYISINSMYVADDAKQRGKMSREVYQDMGREIAEYQSRILRLIQSGNSSQKILDRWELKIQALEGKKREYEDILKQDLSGVDEEFTMLRDMVGQFKMSVRRSQVFGAAAA